ncbi:MAG: dehydratase [Chloroflexi bacterium]|nr:MAG: dehydratase [Chloroflexota bacterium]
MQTKTQGLYFEEFHLGDRLSTVGRTVTEADVVNFAGLSGDFNQIHTDVEFSKSSPIGQRVAHGLLVLSITSGLAMRTGILEGTVIYFREINDWKFVKTVFIGDTIHVDLEVVETKAIPRISGGSVVIALDVKNQNNEIVMKGSWTVLVMSQPQ